jgi:uncharacterized iron-regulated membrane protein
MKFSRLNRLVHRWGSVLIAVPLAVVIVTGVILQLKKELAWIQPPTHHGSADSPTIRFDEILAAVQRVAEANVHGWEDIDRLDVRPGKGMLKVRCRNQWEVQLDAVTGQVLQVAYRRSDLIESIHDGSFFGDPMKLWVFLPSAIVLGVLWCTGIYLFALPYWAKWTRRSTKRRSQARPDAAADDA